MILLLKENILVNKESTILPQFIQDAMKNVFEFNELPEVDPDIIDKEVLFTKVA